MAKQKYDWNSLKLQFFQSDIDEVYNFLKWIYGEKAVKWNLKNKVKGWSKEKQEYKEKIFKKALEKKEKEEAKNLEIDMSELKKAKKASIKLLMKKISDIIEWWDDVNVKDVERILKMIKTELWEPTTISKNDTTFRWEPIDESKFIQD